MYTIDDQKEEDLYEENDYDNNWDNRKGLVFKIIIIILCVIVLIWLIKALKNNRSTSDNGVVHATNTEKIRFRMKWKSTEYIPDFKIPDHKHVSLNKTIFFDIGKLMGYCEV